MSKETGGPAFAQSGFTSVGGQNFVSEDCGGAGMTLRDYFAAKAMQGDWAAQDDLTGVFLNGDSEDDLYLRAKLYYRMADAMLRARNE